MAKKFLPTNLEGTQLDDEIRRRFLESSGDETVFFSNINIRDAQTDQIERLLRVPDEEGCIVDATREEISLAIKRITIKLQGATTSGR